MKEIKQLAKQTAIYGLSTTLGRFLSYLLIFLHTGVFVPEQLGIVTNLYAYFAFLLVLFTYGTETGYFRYVEVEKNKEKVYTTLLTSIIVTSSLFILSTILFAKPLANAINYTHNKEYIVWFGFIIGLDTFCSIPLARLRHENRAIDFAKVNILSVIINVGLNLYFLLLAPFLYKKFGHLGIGVLFNQSAQIKFVFIANLISSIFKFLLLIVYVRPGKILFDFVLLKQILNYSYPILIIGLAGMVNQNADKILIPFIIDEAKDPIAQLGIYGANFKLSVIMIVFIQMFRYAAEPFFFSKEKDANAKDVYAQVMKYFIIFSLFIVISIILYLDLIKYLIGEDFYKGSKVVPYILFGNLFLGIFYNLSIWYKLNNITIYGAIIAMVGSCINVTINLLWVPKIGYMGAAYAIIITYFSMMVISYIWGRKHYQVKYPISSISLFVIIALSVIFLNQLFSFDNITLKYIYKTLLFFIFTIFILIKEKKAIKKFINQ